MKALKIGFLQKPTTSGGPGSFQVRFERWLKQHNHKLVFLSESKSEVMDVILAIGTPLRFIPLLIKWKKRGIPIVLRLAGPFWRYRTDSVPIKMHLEQRFRNIVMRFVRHHLADYVVYQSRFVQDWWHAECGAAPCPEAVIYNGVDLQDFAPSIDNNSSKGKPILVIAESSIDATPPTIKVLTDLPQLLVSQGVIRAVEVYGKLTPRVKMRLKNIAHLKVMGWVPYKQMRYIFSRRGIYLSLKVIHSCPNVVLEALASGMPVVGFDTGALSELVSPEGGCIVPYGANPWLLEPPDVELLFRAIDKVAKRLDDYRIGARVLVGQRFSLETMAINYTNVFRKVISSKAK